MMPGLPGDGSDMTKTTTIRSRGPGRPRKTATIQEARDLAQWENSMSENVKHKEEVQQINDAQAYAQQRMNEQGNGVYMNEQEVPSPRSVLTNSSADPIEIRQQLYGREEEESNKRKLAKQKEMQGLFTWMTKGIGMVAGFAIFYFLRQYFSSKTVVHVTEQEQEEDKNLLTNALP